MKSGFWYFVLFILTLTLLAHLKTWLIPFFALSPQHTVNPTALVSDFDPTATTAIFNNRPIKPPTTLSQLPALTHILGSSSGEKRIEVDLTNQRLYAYEGDRLIFNFLISSGKWSPTPTGEFTIWIKLRSTKMEGGSQALRTYYYLPNVPYVMYFYNADIPQWRGYGIHGAYWHNNFGHPMSHGCINMDPDEAALLYAWASPDANGRHTTYASADNPGTRIVIYGTTPLE